ncbi:hypothetical protein D3C76_290600 [compost metagenome]
MFLLLEAVRIRQFLFVVSLLMVTLLSACKNDVGFINARWIAGVSLTPVTTSDQSQVDLPLHFETLMLKDSTLIKTIAEAMNKSDKLLGELDWAPEFDMKLVYGDGYSEKYLISIGDKLGNKGLFTTAENSGQGYSIPVKNADQIRKLIYGTANNTNNEQTESLETSVTVTGPVTISHNDLYPVTARTEFLNLQLLDGSYSEDWTTPGPMMGRNWSGRFGLTVTDDQGRTLSRFPLSEHFEAPMSFNDLFQIQFEDYNGDGDPDFTMCQYGSSNGYFYKLFTLRKDNVIEELGIVPGVDLFISSPEGYSIKLDKVDDHSFKRSYYDNAAGEELEDIFQWDGSAFQRLDK